MKIKKFFEPEVEKNIEEAEYNANIFISKIFLVWLILDFVIAIIALLFCFIIDSGVTESFAATYNAAKIAGIGTLATGLIKLVMIIWTKKVKGKNRLIKYFLFITMFLSLFIANISYIPGMELILAIPVIFGVFYFRPGFSVFISVTDYVTFLLAKICKLFVPVIELNFVETAEKIEIEKGTALVDSFSMYGSVNKSEYIESIIIDMIFPAIIFFFIIGALSVLCAKRGKDLLIKQNDLSKKSAALQKEMEIASSIQLQMLPDKFPNYDTEGNYDLYAMSTPAKSVGGDFYDYYMLDKTHIVCTIADVCGKGIPAAIFMSRSMTCVKNYIDKDLVMGSDLAKALSNAAGKINEALKYRNSNFTFVTAWVGVLDIVSGELVYINAGHVPPIVIDSNGKCRNLSELSGMVFGIADNEYEVFATKLSKKDRLFICTDGVVEANETTDNSSDKVNNPVLYGEDRLKEVLSKCSTLSCKETVEAVYSDILDFTKNTPQFDDITMLTLEYIGH